MHEVLKICLFTFTSNKPIIIDEDDFKIEEDNLRVIIKNKLYDKYNDINKRISKLFGKFIEICKINNVNYNEVRECWLLDPRIGVSHTSVFSNKTEPYDGKCLPKDIKALIQQSNEQGYNPLFLEEVEKSNKRIGNLRK
jgi:UDP-glucose 6-dehydrogenase